jgi:hypothetical protein
VNARLAATRGIRFVINTDAHATTNLDYMRYGLFQARRAGLTKEHVLNTLPFARFDAWRRGKKGRPNPPAKPAPAAAPPTAKPAAKTPPKPAAKPKAPAKPAAKPKASPSPPAGTRPTPKRGGRPKVARPVSKAKKR